MDKSPKPVSNIAPFGLRMQPALREKVQLAAKKNARSLNQEIIARLEASFEPSQGSASLRGDSVYDSLARSTRSVESMLELEESLRNAASISETLKSIDFTAIESITKMLENMTKATQELDKDKMELIKKLSSQSASDILQEKIDQMGAQRSTEKENLKKRP